MPAWSDSERNKMFLAMIELMAPHGSNNKLPSWNLVADRMESGFTGEAVRYVGTLFFFLFSFLELERFCYCGCT